MNKLKHQNISNKNNKFKDIKDNLSIIKYVILSDISSFLNLDRKKIWKKIKRDKITFNLFDIEINLQLYRDKNNYFYTSEKEFNEFKEKIIKINNKYKNLIPLKEGVNKITKFKNSIYKNIEDGKVKIIKENQLIILDIYKFNSTYYLNKNELLKKENRYYKKLSFICLLKNISYDKIFNKKLSKNNEIELCFDNLNVKIKAIKFNSQHFFSELEISKIYYFVKEVKEKIKGLEKLKLPKKKYSKYLLPSSLRLFSKEKEICVQLHKLNNYYYYKQEDKEKIEKLFN
jgi:hypothetical protein